jgi:hypothetical protein
MNQHGLYQIRTFPIKFGFNHGEIDHMEANKHLQFMKKPLGCGSNELGDLPMFYILIGHIHMINLFMIESEFNWKIQGLLKILLVGLKMI